MSTRKALHQFEFPPAFVWGAASSSYQIEGGARPDQRGRSVWDAFCERPGAVHNGHTGAIACDHFHRFRDDIALMKRIGLQAYRFSIAWPRVLPSGDGTVHAEGLAFYERLVDALLDAGIVPWVTLYHWDLPETLQHRGGWQNREVAKWFSDYAETVAMRLGDRVEHWITLNEPQIFLGLGLGQGIHAPGLKLSISEQLQATHFALLAHGRAVQALRATSRIPASIGWAPAIRVEYPASDAESDIAAARAATLGVLKADMWNTAWYADPIYFGNYPDDGLRLFGIHAPQVAPGDMETIRAPLDFLGVNIYSGTPTSSDARNNPVALHHPVGCARNSLNWPVAPPALRWGPRFLWERYRSPIVITENGMSNLDWVDLDGRVRDPQRIDFTRRYLLELNQAIADGADIRGYFHWSVMDNFEWAEGYKERFGMIHVDFETQKRTLKDSANWYHAVIESNGAALRTPADQVLRQVAEEVDQPEAAEGAATR